MNLSRDQSVHTHPVLFFDAAAQEAVVSCLV